MAIIVGYADDAISNQPSAISIFAAWAWRIVFTGKSRLQQPPQSPRISELWAEC